MQSRSNDKVLWVIAWCAFLFIVAWAFSGCTTQKKATRYFNEHLEVAANYCADLFPIRDSLVVRDSIHFDTLWQEPFVITDTFTLQGETVYIKRPCPPSQLVTKYVTRDTTIYRENTARLAALQAEIRTLNGQVTVLSDNLKEAKESVKEKATALWWHRLVILALLGWIFRRPLLTLVNPIKKFYPF